MRPKIFFIRHGETDWNAEARFQGQQDIPLNDKGRGQAKRNGTVLRDLIDPAEYEFVASPLGRTRETMEIVREAIGLERQGYQLDDRLRELSFGIWEGKTIYELQEEEPVLWQERQSDKWYFRPEEGESYHDLSVRVRPWFDAISRPSVVVAHGGVNRAIRSILGGLDESALAASAIPQDKIMVIENSGCRWV